jgi:biopolymer transport protein ExbB/TolQ
VRVLATGAVEEALAQIASALRTPVLVLALLALLVCALEAGRFAAELYTRLRRKRDSMSVLVRRAVMEPDQVGALAMLAPSAFAGEALVRVVSTAHLGDVAAIERALVDYELAVERRLDRTRILVRAGPALGLMGTLIPLAPGLAALGRGAVGTLASDLRTAFAATTVGLLVGTVAYMLTLTRTRLYSEDLAALEYALPAAAPTGNGPFAVPTSDRQVPPLPPPSSAGADTARIHETP